jgi:hypothetical protein
LLRAFKQAGTVRDVDASSGRRGRVVRLMVSVTGLSGTVYPAGTEVFTSGHGPSVDAFIAGDWLPLRWWEFAEPADPSGAR